MGSVGLTHPADHPALSSDQSTTVHKIYAFVEQFFQNPKFDASHDFRHVKRVTATATAIYEAEKTTHPALDAFTVLLGALLHDVEDKKYAQSKDAIRDALLDVGMSAPEALRLQRLVEGVSYSSESKDPAKVQALIAEIPELAIVQDADRLDAIGAIGIGRCFAFGGAKGARSLDDSIEHFHEKLFKLGDMMKTDTGRRMAAERTRRLREFVGWWESEVQGSS
ncbi:uncharacterized protein HMPREF1541_05387 [Cyphellophora europaea CBS 101466]|uniref:HD/PDEase domain-containing protein n=1 Tax=Cyphellophora europaea (strain CBS 101466) TaxID=1220924 RepID=W2RTW4_CYPE1|nr:uncharacterized protein HMPREF1541_05387 [Cyphellophora europaea CBS 101466]ETN39164.1 hypothetical protein HMPREF1541_05387 [Cyphellophora europaea CBS 101466]